MADESENVNLKFQLTLNEHQSNENTLNSSAVTSPKRSNQQLVPTRWSIPREERRKLVEQMEWRRDEQKRAKRANWFKTDAGNDFMKFWREKTFKLEAIDIKLMKLNQKNYEKLNNLTVENPVSEVVLPSNQVKSDNNTNNTNNTSTSNNSVNNTNSMTEERSRTEEKEKDRMHYARQVDIRDRDRDRMGERRPNDYDRDSRVIRDRDYDKRSRVVVSENDNERNYSTSTPSLPANFFIAFEFDYLELLLKDLSTSGHSDLASSAAFLLNLSEKMFMSDRRLFYHQLFHFPDQPNFSYYSSDDDGRSINSIKDFDGDALDLYSQKYSYKSQSHSYKYHHGLEHVKFYRERAVRYRFVATQSRNFFLNEIEIENSIKEIEFLCRRSEDFYFWLNRILANRHSIFITSGPLLKAFALLLVLTTTVSAKITPLSLSRRLWCNKKYGDTWTLKEIKHYYTQIENHENISADCKVIDPVRFYFWSPNKASKMSKEADYQEFPLFIFRQNKNKPHY